MANTEKYKKLTILNFALIIFCPILVYSLFYTKERVRIMHSQITQLTNFIKTEEESAKTLAAEFAYLTRSENLKKISAVHNLQLSAIKPSQMREDLRVQEDNSDHNKIFTVNKSDSINSKIHKINYNNNKHNVRRWRYKKITTPNKD